MQRNVIRTGRAVAASVATAIAKAGEGDLTGGPADLAWSILGFG
ncbi:hypothetical protein [Mycobacterium sp. URHD0025]|nr:hypothetical protein [Mycobacterium sp. URHD0025]